MDRPIDPQEQVVQTANQNTQMRIFNQSGVFVIGLFAIVALFIIGIALYFFKTRSQSLTPGQSKRISETAVSKKEWHGIIATKKGFVKINADGQIENGADNQPAFFLPPGTEADYAKNFGNYTFGTVTFKGLQLLPDGKLVFSGSTKQQSAAKENTIYSWLIDSKETPKALVQLPEGQNIQSFAFSPDSKSVAVIAVTQTTAELYHEEIDSKALSQQEQLKIYQQRAKDLQEQLGTISIYDVATAKAMNSIKLDTSMRDGITQLIWSEQGLFVKDYDKIILLNPSTGQVVTKSQDNPNQSIVVSTDGSQFLDMQTLTLYDTSKNKATGQMNIPELIAPEEFKQGMDADQYFIFLGPATFSPHSQNVALEAGSVSLKNFRIWEQNFENGKTRKLVDLNTLGLDSTLGTKLRHYVPFMTYNPTGTKLVFALYGENPDTHVVGRLIDVVSLDLTTLKAFRNNFLVEMNNLRELSFLGWYQAASTQSSTRPQTPGPLEASSTTDWNVYLNVKYDYQFKYPPDWKVNNSDQRVISLYPYSRNKRNYEGKADTIIIYAAENPKHLTIEQAVTTDPRDGGICCIDRYTLDDTSVGKIFRQDITVDRVNGKKFILPWSEAEEVYILKGDFLYNIENNGGKPFESVYDRILSTFKFTDQSQAN